MIVRRPYKTLPNLGETVRAISAFSDALRALNEAAYAAIRASKDTTALPNIDRQALRHIARETDRLVDQGESSGVVKC